MRPSQRRGIDSAHDASMCAAMRLTIRFLTCLVFLTLGLQVGLHGSGLASQTAMFRGDAQHTGVYSDANFLATPQVRWTFHTQGYVDSSPAVADARVFFGSTDGALYSVRTEYKA